MKTETGDCRKLEMIYVLVFVGVGGGERGPSFTNPALIINER